MKTYRFAVHNMNTGNSFWIYKRFPSVYYADVWAMKITFRNSKNRLYNIIPTYD